MFQVGEYIIYSSMGVCRVKDITVMSLLGEDREYYTLAPLKQTGEIMIPVDSPVFMRPVVTREEADRLIDMIPTIRADAFHGRGLQELKAHYGTALRSHDCADLIELVMSIYAKKQYREQMNQKIGQIDENCMKRAESLLYDEFSIALGIPVDEVESYIRSRIKAAK